MKENQSLFFDFELESGTILPELKLVYHTAGKLNANKSNVVLVCHALTANSNAFDWWKGVVGESEIINPDEYFIICINSLGSYYGSTSPRSINPKTGECYGMDFPFFTVRDVARANAMLLKDLGLSEVHLGMAASFGGYQLLEMTFEQIQFERLMLISTSANETTWGRAIHSSQRMALETDPTFYENSKLAGRKGMAAARSIGMLTYRGSEAFNISQAEDDNSKKNDFKVESYLRYQGKKIGERFHAHCYYKLGECLDSHDISRNRFNNISEALSTIKTNCLVVAVSTDILTPPVNQKVLADNIQGAEYVEIESNFGHDAFLVEHQAISALLRRWL